MDDQMYTGNVADSSSMSSTEPESSHAFTQDGVLLNRQREHQPQEWSQPQQQYQTQQEYQAQLSLLSQQQSQQISSQMQMQFFQHEPTGSLHAPLDAGAYDLPMSEPQSGTSWSQAVTFYDISRYDGGAFYNPLGMASPNGEEQVSTSLPDLSLSTPSALHRTSGTQSDSGVVNRKTPTVEGSPSANHGRRQNSNSGNGTRRSSPRHRRQQGEAYHKAARRTKKKLWEKQYYEALLRMDELTKYHRVAQAMRMCGHPPRDPEEYKSMS